MRELFELFFEISSLFLGVLSNDISSVIGFVSLFIGIVGFLNDICH